MAPPEPSGRFPARPALPIALICGLLFWAGCAAAYSSGSGLSSEACVQAALPLALVGASAGALASWKRVRMAALALAALAVGGLFGLGGAADVHALADRLDAQPAGRMSFQLAEDSRRSGFSEAAGVTCVLEDGRTAYLQATIKGQGEPLYQGDRITALASFTRIDYDEDDYAWREGACADVVLSSVRVEPSHSPIEPLRELRVRVIESIGAQDPAHVLLQALVCGYRREMSGTPTYEAFKQCGLAHLVAVSGAHLVIVTGLFASLLGAVGLPRRITVGVLIAVMASYLVLSGFPLSAIRATIMSSVGVLALVGKRRPSSGNALGIGLFLMLGASPASALSVSLALSALSTLGIVLFAPLFLFWLERTPLRHASFALEALSLTLASNLLSLPFAISLFSALPFITPVANVVCAPLFPLACGLGLVAGMVSAVPTPLSGLLLIPASWCASALIGIVEALAGVPYCAVPAALEPLCALVLSAAAAIALWAWWPRPTRRVGAAVLAAGALFFGVTLAQVDFEDSIIMLDVGQGDAILVRSQGKTLLVDTGNRDAKLLRELGRNHIVRLDGLLITHADDDHYGSMDMLARYVQVGQVFVADGMTTCKAGKPTEIRGWAEAMGADLAGIGQGDGFAIGRFSARAVWPQALREDGGNADSLCTLLSYDADGDGQGDFTALLTGDAEKDQVAKMLEGGLVGRVDILKVGHHGSRNGTTPEQMRALDPSIALISCGAHNRYGHPTAEILAQLDAIGCATFRSDRDGEVKCTLGADGMRVSKLG